VVEKHIGNTGITPDKAVADKGYGYTEIYSYLYHIKHLPCILTEMTMPARITKPVEQSLFMIAAMIVISVQGVIRSERLSLIEVSKKFVIWPTVKYVNSARF